MQYTGITVPVRFVGAGDGDADAKIEWRFRCHTSRATGLTDHLTKGGCIEAARRTAEYWNAKITGLYNLIEAAAKRSESVS